MKTDRELLELAAKAAGIEHLQTIEGEPFEYFGGWLRLNDDGEKWAPLTDDGDALRLAVKLEMQVSIGFRRIDASICSDSDELSINTCEPKVGDLYAATRRAIVRAAAAIGETL